MTHDMLNGCGLSRRSSYRCPRLGGHTRCITSVVPKADIQLKDFKVKNEPILGYMPGSKERAELEAALKKHADKVEECPIIIGGKEYRTDNVQYQPMVRKELMSND